MVKLPLDAYGRGTPYITGADHIVLEAEARRFPAGKAVRARGAGRVLPADGRGLVEDSEGLEAMTLAVTVAALFLAIAAPPLAPFVFVLWCLTRWRVRPGTLRDGRFALKFGVRLGSIGEE